MSTPILWIVVPMLVSGLSLFFLRYPRILKWGGAALSLVLGLNAALMPINESFRLVFWEVQVGDQLLVFGRRFILSSADRPVVVVLFLLHFFWLLLFNPKHVPSQFPPFSLAGIVLILTAYAVDPIFYGALFFAFLALINVALLSPPGGKPTPGVLRFLIYQILGMLFILFAAWLASWIDLNRGDVLMLSRSLLILALGFSFLLSIFPFISWIPMVAEKNHPFLTGYLFNTYFLGVFLFGSRFIMEGGWLARGLNLQVPLQLAGVLMLGFGSALAVVSKHLGRLTAALVIAEIGRSLLAFSIFIQGLPIYFSLVFIQALALGVWSLSRTHLQRAAGDLAEGKGTLSPVVLSGLALGYFTLAGLPLLAGFPIYLSLGNGLTPYPFWVALFLILGSVGLLVGGLRTLRSLFKEAGGEPPQELEDRFDQILILGLNAVLVLLGAFPQLVYRAAQAITALMLGS